MLYIPFQQYDYVGGPSTFMRNLKKFLDENNFIYSEEYSENDDIFFAIKHDLLVVQNVKNHKKRIIQRLDGTQISKESLKPIRKIYKNYTDYVIFQSQHSKLQCFKNLGKIPKNRFEIIINGVDKSVFYPNFKINIEKRIKFAITGNLLQKYKVEPSIYALDIIAKKYDIELHIAGPVSNEVKELIARDYVIYHGTLNIYQVSELLRNVHIFLFTIANPPCPNSVIEAISTGIPIVSFNSGSIPELCWFSKDLLVHVSDDPFHKYDDFNFNSFLDKIEECINNYNYYRQNALDHAHLHSFKECGKKYIMVFQNINQIKQKRNNLIYWFKFKSRKLLINRFTFSLFSEKLYFLSKNKLVNLILKIISIKIKNMSAKNSKIFKEELIDKINSIN